MQLLIWFDGWVLPVGNSATVQSPVSNAKRANQRRWSMEVAATFPNSVEEIDRNVMQNILEIK